jgi:phosphoribosylformimino-5-aminoimidazole carboxamide ribotide isomerase
MVIIPAIDLWNGTVVRFKQGSPSQATCYPESPQSYGKKFIEAGFKRIQLIDISAAKSGKFSCFSLIQSLREMGLCIQYGGGIRSLKEAHDCFQAGVERLIIGTAAFTQPQLLQQLLMTFGKEKIVLALDLFKGEVAIHGWTQKIPAARAVYPEGIFHLQVTDITRDGMQQGVDPSLYGSLKKQHPKLNIIAAGGVTTIHDIQLLSEQQIEEVVVGKAFYETH